MKRIADSGFLIALLDPSDSQHAWAVGLSRNEATPWLVCEPVLTEASFMVGTPEPLLEMLGAGDLEIALDLETENDAVRALAAKYRDHDMDLADACVVRMSELHRDCMVLTTDRRDFSLYRRFGRRNIPCRFPEDP